MPIARSCRTLWSVLGQRIATKPRTIWFKWTKAPPYWKATSPKINCSRWSTGGQTFSDLTLQKLAQLGEDQLQGLHDVCCLWIYLLPHLQRSFQGTVVDKHLKMFWDGMLGQPVKILVLDFSTEKLKLIRFKGSPRNPSQFFESIFPRKNHSNRNPS